MFFTIFCGRFIGMKDGQNITLNLPSSLLKTIKRIAAEREISVTRLVFETFDKLAKNDQKYQAEKARSLANRLKEIYEEQEPSGKR